MERSSEFIEGKARFGSYPTQNDIEVLEEYGVRYFVNLTKQDEKKITPYTTKYTKISFPITDIGTPDHWVDFARFIARLCHIIRTLKKGEKVYIHCKGGHGRAGIVVACVLCYIYKLTPQEALRRTLHYHGQRKIMRDRWRTMGSPQTHSQKQFVHKFFRPVYFREDSDVPARVKDIDITEEDDEKLYEKLYAIYQKSSSQLLCTGLRPIITHDDSLSFWLEKVRHALYLS